MLESLDECFSEMELLLGQQDWLAGDEFSLADIAWVPLQFTLENLAGYELDELPNVAQWTQRLTERSSYQNGISKWWPPEIKRA